MSKSPRTGLCIGGPYAGRMIAQPGTQFEVLSEEGTSSFYRWHHLGGPLALWIVEGCDITQAINAMAEAYVEKQINGGR